MDDAAAGVHLYGRARAYGRTVIDAYASPLPSVTVVWPDDPRPEERLGYPTRGVEWTAIDDGMRAECLVREVEYVLVYSSSHRHVDLEIAAEVAAGRRSRFSFSTMVTMAGTLMAEEAVRWLLGRRGGTDCRGYFFNPARRSGGAAAGGAARGRQAAARAALSQADDGRLSETLHADLLLNGVALVAVLASAVALGRLRAAGPVERRLRALYLGLAFLLAVRMLHWAEPRPLFAVGDLAGLFLCAAAIGLGAALLLPELARDDLWRLAALGLAAPAAMLVVQRLREARLAERLQPSLLTSLCRLPDNPDRDALIAADPLTASGTPLEGGALALYDPGAIDALAAHRVVTQATPLEAEAAGAARNLLDEHAATHLVRLTRDPPRFIAVAAGQIGGAGPRDIELEILSRLAERAR